MDPELATYIAHIEPEHRPLFDWVCRIIEEACPNAEATFSYNMPTYKQGKCRLHVGVWSKGISIYGWKRQGDGGFTKRHPELQTSTGTIRLRPQQAAGIKDAEIRELARTALAQR